MMQELACVSQCHCMRKCGGRWESTVPFVMEEADTDGDDALYSESKNGTSEGNRWKNEVINQFYESSEERKDIMLKSR